MEDQSRRTVSLNNLQQKYPTTIIQKCSNEEEGEGEEIILSSKSKSTSALQTISRPNQRQQREDINSDDKQNNVEKEEEELSSSSSTTTTPTKTIEEYDSDDSDDCQSTHPHHHHQQQHTQTVTTLSYVVPPPPQPAQLSTENLPHNIQSSNATATAFTITTSNSNNKNNSNNSNRGIHCTLEWVARIIFCSFSDRYNNNKENATSQINKFHRFINIITWLFNIVDVINFILDMQLGFSIIFAQNNQNSMGILLLIGTILGRIFARRGDYLKRMNGGIDWAPFCQNVNDFKSTNLQREQSLRLLYCLTFTELAVFFYEDTCTVLVWYITDSFSSDSLWDVSNAWVTFISAIAAMTLFITTTIYSINCRWCNESFCGSSSFYSSNNTKRRNGLLLIGERCNNFVTVVGQLIMKILSALLFIILLCLIIAYFLLVLLLAMLFVFVISKDQTQAENNDIDNNHDDFSYNDNGDNSMEIESNENNNNGQGLQIFIYLSWIIALYFSSKLFQKASIETEEENTNEKKNNEDVLVVVGEEDQIFPL